MGGLDVFLTATDGTELGCISPPVIPQKGDLIRLYNQAGDSTEVIVVRVTNVMHHLSIIENPEAPTEPDWITVEVEAVMPEPWGHL